MHQAVKWTSQRLKAFAPLDGDKELLVKLKQILLGGSSPATPVKSHRVAEGGGNADGFLPRLRAILIREQGNGSSSEESPQENEARMRRLRLFRLGKEGKVDEARTLLQEIVTKGYVPDLLVLGGLHEHLSRMQGLLSSYELPKPPLSELEVGCSISVMLFRSGKLLEAYRAVLTMLKQGMTVDNLVLNTVIYGLWKAGFPEECESIVQEMVTRWYKDHLEDTTSACTAFDDMLKLGVCPDVVLYDALVDGLFAVGKVKEAFFVFRGGSNRKEFEASTCDRLMDSLCDLGLEDEVCYVADVMVKQGLAEDSAAALDSRVANLCVTGRVHMAEKLLRRLVSADLRVDYKRVLGSLCSAGKLAEAAQFLDDMSRKGLVSDTETYNGHLSLLCDALLEKREHSLLQSLPASLELREASTYSILIEALCKANNVDDAYALYERMPDKRSASFKDSSSYVVILRKLCEADKVDDARTVLEDFTRQADQVAVSEAANLVVQALCRAAKLSEAFELMDWMQSKDLHPDAVTFNLVIKDSSRQGKRHTVLNLYEAMCKRGYKPDIGSYNAAMAASSKMKEALALFQQMVRSSVIPDATTCSILVDGLCREGKVDAAFKILQLTPGLGCLPGLGSYNTALEALCKQGDTERARELLKEMEFRGRSPDVTGYDMVLKQLGKSGRHAEMQELFMEVVSNGIIPSDSTFRSVFSGLCDRGQLETASTLVKVLLDARLALKESVYKPYIIGLMKAGRTKEASEFFDDVVRKKCKPGPVELLSCFVEARLVEDGYHHYVKLVEEGQRPVHLLVELVTGLEHDVSAASKFLVAVMGRAGTTVTAAAAAASSVIDALVEAGKLRQARQIYCETAGNIRDRDRSGGTLDKLMEALLRARESGEACQLFEAGTEGGWLDDHNGYMCKHLVLTLVALGDVDGTNRVLEAAAKQVGRRRQSSPFFLDAVIFDLCKLGRFEEAANALEFLHRKGILGLLHQQLVSIPAVAFKPD